jgi:hypothetical protein
VSRLLAPFAFVLVVPSLIAVHAREAVADARDADGRVIEVWLSGGSKNGKAAPHAYMPTNLHNNVAMAGAPNGTAVDANDNNAASVLKR